jgi:hypothetical protein
MKNVRLVFEELREKCEKQHPKQAPAIQWLTIGKSSAEDFTANYSSGTIRIKAAGYLGAIHALKKIFAGITSGHLADFLSITTPHFKIRPLWIDASLKHVGAESSKIHQLCKKVLELGYNAVVVDAANQTNLSSLCSQLQSYGLKVLLKPAPIQKSASYNLTHHLKTLEVQNPYFDFLFWESQWNQPQFTKDSRAEAFTLRELVLDEARLIEAALPSKKLIFYLPAANEQEAKQCAPWMPALADDLGKESILAFSAVAGDFYADFLPAHPFWDQLRSKVDRSSAALMPILNVGNVKHSQGLGPVIVHDYLDEFRGRYQMGHFSGFLAVAHDLPGDGGIHECNLWTAAQVQWNPEIAASLWVETWCSAYRPDWNYSNHTYSLKKIRAVSKQTAFLHFLSQEKNRSQYSSQECRFIAESLLSQLQEIQAHLEKEEKKRVKKSDKTTLWDYFSYFLCDTKRTLMHVLPSFNISLPLLMNENDPKESFWTEVHTHTGKQEHERIKFLETPNSGTPGSRMHAIYQENRLFL